MRIYPFRILKQIVISIIAYPILSYFVQDDASLIMVAISGGNIAILLTAEYQKYVALAAKTVFM